MKWGQARAVLETARAHGKPTPLDDQPQLNQWTARYWIAFSELSTCRQYGLTIGPIPWTAIDAYAARAGIMDRDDFDAFASVIAGLDGAYLDAVREMEKNVQPNAPMRSTLRRRA